MVILVEDKDNYFVFMLSESEPGLGARKFVGWVGNLDSGWILALVFGLISRMPLTVLFVCQS